LKYEESNANYSTLFVSLISVPGGVQPLIELFLPLVSKLSLDQAKLFGYDKKEWSKAILETIEPDQISPQFGGTKGTKAVPKA
jgi:hypothetical protein